MIEKIKTLIAQGEGLNVKFKTENSNKPYINGLITMSNITSHSKNPTIAKFFRYGK